jgi:TonB family protein
VSAHTLQPQAGQLHGRQMVMLVIVALHALVIALMMTMRVLPEVLNPPSFAPIDHIPEDPRPVEKPPELMPNTPSPMPTTFQIPVIQPPIDIPLDDSNAITAPLPVDAGPVAVAVDGPGTARVPDIPSTPLQFRAVRPADDYYPSASLSLQEEGTAIVRVCVAPSGKLDGKPAIETTSGSARLDAAALNWAREALRFTPATQGGAPVAACKGFRVTFTLH